MREIQLTKNSGIYDISQISGPATITDSINKAGICTFTTQINSIFIPEEGDAVSVKYDDTSYFVGYIVKIGRADADQDKLTCYDQLWYLKAKDGYVFKNKTASDVAKVLFSTFSLKVGKIEETGYNLGSQTFDDKAGLDIISDCLNLTLRNTKNYFYIKDEAGLATLRNIKSSVSDLVVSASSNIFGFSYERGIDSDTYNQIKLVVDNSTTGKREVYLTKDSSTIKKWGLLQYFEKLDDSVNAAQAKSKADAMLMLKNRVQQTLSVSVLGDKSVRAGNMIYVDLPLAPVKKFLLCTGAAHTLDSVSHTVKADFKLV